jgi:uncharacterized protein YyaL (SSP411 family)
MSAVVAITGQGGWPMSVFLTPDGQPFFGGTYFPPVRRYDMPAFREVLESVHNVWSKDRGQILESSRQISDHLKSSADTGNAPPDLQPDILEKASMALAQAYDWKFGGWGSAPKFPQPMTIEFLLRRASLGDRFALEIAEHALQAMIRGGMYDLVGGGFSRYSTDNTWHTPHFEKMLYDNALLSQAYLHAYLITRAPTYRRVCQETLDFIVRELADPEGGFYSSLDADSEGQEGKYYLWKPAEIEAAIPDPQDARWLIDAYHVSESGNFEGSNILARSQDDATLAERDGVSATAIVDRFSRLHGQLLRARQDRVRPATDDKVLVAWNALAMISFAEAGRYLNRPDYVDMAIRNAGFLIRALHPSDRLLRSWRLGQAQHNACLEDYAALILALLSTYQSNPQNRWYEAAVNLSNEMLAHFTDPSGGFYDTRDDQELLFTRPKDLQDNALPCGNSLAAMSLLQLSAYSGQSALRQRAEDMLRFIQAWCVRYPTAFANWLCAIDFGLNPVSEVALLAPATQPEITAFSEVLWGKYRPRLVSASSTLPLPESAPPLLFDRPLMDNLPTAYVCHSFVCKKPVNNPDEFRSQLDGHS